MCEYKENFMYVFVSNNKPQMEYLQVKPYQNDNSPSSFNPGFDHGCNMSMQN